MSVIMTTFLCVSSADGLYCTFMCMNIHERYRKHHRSCLFVKLFNCDCWLTVEKEDCIIFNGYVTIKDQPIL